MDELRCRECERAVSRDAVGLPNEAIFVADDFVVCRQCDTETAADWEATKAALIADGHEIPCASVRSNFGLAPSHIRPDEGMSLGEAQGLFEPLTDVLREDDTDA